MGPPVIIVAERTTASSFQPGNIICAQILKKPTLAVWPFIHWVVVWLVIQLLKRGQASLYKRVFFDKLAFNKVLLSSVWTEDIVSNSLLNKKRKIFKVVIWNVHISMWTIQKYCLLYPESKKRVNKMDILPSKYKKMQKNFFH